MCNSLRPGSFLLDMPEKLFSTEMMSDSWKSRSQWEALCKSICQCSATGITVYSNGHRTTQIIVHEENFEYRVAACDEGYSDDHRTAQIIVHEENFEYRVAACDEGYPRYFHLNKGYRVVQFGLVKCGEGDFQTGPFLLVSKAKYILLLIPIFQKNIADN